MMNDLTQRVLPQVRTAEGDIQLPGSKSISNRVLLMSALAQGATRLHGLLDSDDTRYMLQALRQLGVHMAVAPSGVWEVQGCDHRFPVESAELFLGNAGTAVRPLTAALAILGGNYRLSGVPRMHERPIGDLVTALEGAGASIQYLGTPGYPPLSIGRGTIRSDAPMRIKGAVSSQFLTALLMAAPLHTARSGDPVRIEIEGELISQPYVQITLNLMRRFGVEVDNQDWRSLTVPGDSKYRSPGDLHIEGDASSASYFMAMGAIGGGPVRVRGVGSDSIQGDIAFADTLERMGATVLRESDALEISGVQVGAGDRLRAFDEDFNLIPDAAMTAAALALFADGPCMLRNIGSWRVKETDRIDAMHAELAKLGARVESGADWLRVYPVEPGGWRSAVIETYDDHRMAMCFSLASFAPVTVTILDPGCVSKTFPDYFDVFARLARS